MNPAIVKHVSLRAGEFKNNAMKRTFEPGPDHPATSAKRFRTMLENDEEESEKRRQSFRKLIQVWSGLFGNRPSASADSAVGASAAAGPAPSGTLRPDPKGPGVVPLAQFAVLPNPKGPGAVASGLFEVLPDPTGPGAGASV